MSEKKILVVEDDENISELICFNLKKSGYASKAAFNAEDALSMLSRNDFDLILLDVMLPGMDGLDFCKLVRSKRQYAKIPIIMLTARSEDADIVSALELGADDYITKPFSPRVLVARIKTRLRDTSDTQEPDEISIAGITMNNNFHEVKIDGAPVQLTANEFTILFMLCANPGRVYSRDDIITRLHGPGYAITDRAIDVQIAGIRKKLGEKAALIETVRSIGYRFSKA